MQLSLVVLSALLAVTGPPPKAAPDAVEVQHCFLSLTDSGESRVSTKEAGILMKWGVVAGQEVKAKQVLAQLDDVEADLAVQAAEAECDVAKEEAKNTTNVRYAKAAAEVAKVELQQAVDANKRVPGTVALAELNRLKLTWDRSKLEIEKADMDFIIAGLKAKVAEAKKATASEKLHSRQIISPLAGVVVELNKHVGEWVQPGDTLIHVVGLDRLRVEGFLKASEVEPREVAGRPVTLTVKFPRGMKKAFSGTVVYVSPLVNSGYEFRVWAEVENQKLGGYWLLRPGLSADMTIHLK
jgi:multidrug resistance efflux pump